MAQGRAYALIVEAVTTVLFGVRPIHTAKKQHQPQPGLFGTASAFYGVTEVQSRNALHAHMVLWVRSLDPRMIEKFAHEPLARERIIHKIDSIVCASSENFEHLYCSPPPPSEGGELFVTSHPGPGVQIPRTSSIPIQVGDEFFDCADSTCADHLGWVKVVGIHSKKEGLISLRPIKRPSHRSRTGDAIEAEYKQVSDISPGALEIAVEDESGHFVWQWCKESVQASMAITKLKVHGHKIKAAYNTHVHTFTCHKCNGSKKYSGNRCRMGFARRLMACTCLSQVVESKEEPNKAVAAPEVEAPENRPKKSLVCVDMKRLSGWNDAVPKGFSKGMLLFLKQFLDRAKRHLSTRASQNIMEFLYGDMAFCYSDQYQCETSVLLAALLGCNTNVAPLGSKSQAICAMFYLVGYLSKNPIKPHHWSSCISAARRSAGCTNSTAKDSGTDMRNAIFLLQKVLNKLNAMGEVSDTQAAMVLLGQPSFVSSHRFRFVFVHTALEYQMSLNSDAKLAAEADEADFDGWSHPSATQESGDCAIVTPSQEHAPEQTRGQWMYTDVDGNVVTLDQHDHYLHRCRNWDAEIPGVGVATTEYWYNFCRGAGDPQWRTFDCVRGLEMLNLQEYVRHVSIVPMPANRKALMSGTIRYYLFNENHPLHESHVQQLACVAFVTTISGKRPNPPSKTIPKKPGERAKWQRNADFFGVFMGTLLAPWDRLGDCGVHNWQDYQDFMKNLEGRSQTEAREQWTNHIFRPRKHDGEAEPSPSLDFPDPSVEHTLDYVESLANNLRVPEGIKKLTESWRYGPCDKFTKKSVDQAVARAQQLGGNNEAAVENAMAIARLVEKARGGKESVGLRPETKQHLDRLSDQLGELTASKPAAGGRSFPVAGLDASWRSSNKFTSRKWADGAMEEIQARKPKADSQGDPKLLRKFLKRRRPMKFDDLRLGDKKAPTGSEESYALSKDQLAVFDHAVEKFRRQEQLLLFVHGPPGTGKTLLANRIMKAANRIGLGSKFAACTGAAASINKGCTLHYLANMGIRLPPHNQPVTVEQVQVMKQRGGKYGVFVLDEVSMMHSSLASCIERRWREADIIDHVGEFAERKGLKQTAPWGGMNVIWMGDMLQLPPPSRFCRALYYDCVAETKGGDDFDEDTARLAGVRVFREFRKMELSTQNRASGAEGRSHRALIHGMRTKAKPIDEAFVKSMKRLSKADMRDPGWRYAPILVTSNVERHVINKSQVMRYAREKGLPVFTWVNPLVKVPFEVDTSTQEKMDPSARKYFVVGAPAFIGKNVNSAATGIVNGSAGWLHSLSWGPKCEVNLDGNYKPGELVEVPVPHTVNVMLKIKGSKRGEFIGGEIVPMGLTETENTKEDAKLKRSSHPVELGFCVTYHKIQGQTVKRIILALHPRMSCQLMRLNFESLYVAMTRVRRAEDIRVMCWPDADFKHLLKLKRPACFDAWLASYTDEGMWDSKELINLAEADKARAKKLLARSQPFSKYTIKEMKGILGAFGIRPANAPGKNYPRQKQYREALYPAWVEAKASRQKKVTGRYGTKKRKVQDVQPTTPSHRAKRSKVTPTLPDTKMRKRRRTRGKKNGNKSGSRRQRHRGARPHAELTAFTTEETRVIASVRAELRGYERHAPCDQSLKRLWAIVGPHTLWRLSGLALSKGGRMLCDAALTAFACHLTSGSVCYYLDSQIVDNTHNLIDSWHWASTGRTILRNLKDRQVLALPYNAPRAHWWMVFARLERDGTTVLMTQRNSHSGWDMDANNSVRRTFTLLQKLVEKYGNNIGEEHGPEIQWTVNLTCKILPAVDTTQQKGGTLSCGLHCYAHIELAVRGRLFENRRTVHESFIDNLRDRALLYFAPFRSTRQRAIRGDRVFSSATPTRKRKGSSASSRTSKRIGVIHHLTVEKLYFDYICRGAKKVEGRIYSDCQTWRVGDGIRFKPKGRGRKKCIQTTITNIVRYDSFQQMLEAVGVRVCLPQLRDHQLELGVAIYHGFVNYKLRAKKHGVAALHIVLTEPRR